jgi:hypothetical protein
VSGGETARYVVNLVLTSEAELPTPAEAEDLILAQMSGPLDDDGLACLAVTVLAVSGTIG